MRFHVLGPLEVTRERVSVPLGGPKQRAVLAHLIVRANQVVPTDALIDQVWGEEPPESARNVLQTYVSHLRSALGTERIEGRTPGYILHLEPFELDAVRFESLVREARDANGQSDRAASLLKEALELWKGPAFADLAADGSLVGEIARLNDLHLQALEERIGADIACGRHIDVIGEAEALIREHPLRERLWGHLIIALYRSGRQTDALNAYQRLREILADELGVDPSPELKRLHERVLRQDPDLEFKGKALRGYRLLEPLGEGAFGVVYRATQPQIGRDVAIKAIHPELANHPEFVRRFEREAQIVARLEHPHIVPLYDYWREPDGAFLVMRYLRGGSLAELIDAGPLAPDRAARIIDQIASALAAAHRQGVVHRDVKPSNVLLDEEGNAYLSDFGVALDAGSRDRASGTIMRETPEYLSPEQIRLDPATPSSDIYALGIVAYEMLVGDRQVATSSHTGPLDGHLHEPLPSVRKVHPELAPAVDEVIARASAEEATDRFPDVLEAAAAFREALDGTRSVREPLAQSRNPYKGLRAFLEADTGDFFGREVVTERLVQRLAESGAGSRFLAVVGPSGSGKSSIVRAGLVPALRRGALPGSDRWFVVDVLPGSHPLRELESALLGVAVEPPPSLVEHLERDELGLVRSIQRVLPDPDAELVIVLDQFEEVFTLVQDEAERAHVLASLWAAAVEPGARVRIITTLRADFFDAPLSIRGFGELLAARHEALTPMSPEELERAIVAPANGGGLVVEPALVAAIIADVVDRPSALPLLQYALTELAERTEDRVLSLDAYRRIGGVSGALARRSEKLFSAMNEEGRDACRKLFLRLVTVSEDGEETRLRVRRSQLADMADARATEGIIESFGRHRLLAFDRDPDTREPTVEIPHGALLRAWERLRGWIDDARDDMRTQRRLAASTSEWDRSERDPSFLLRGSHLEQLEEWVGTTTLTLSADDRVYLDASARRRDEERTAEQARQARERSLELRSVRRMRALVAVFAVAALVAGSLTVVARNRGALAERQAREARARELATASLANIQADPERAILLALEAVRTTRAADGTVVRQAEEALHQAVEASRVVLRLDVHPVELVYSRDGSRLATAGTSGLGGVDQPVLEPQDREAIVWDATTGERLLTLKDRPSQVVDVEFSPDGSRIATSDDAGIVTIWDGDTGERLLLRHAGTGGTLAQVDFSPDGRTLVATDGFTQLKGHGTIWLWDVRTGHRIRRWSAPGKLCGIAFSPNGGRVAGGLCSPPGGKTFVWDARTGERILTLRGHTDAILDLAWSPDGRRIAAAGANGEAVVWDVRTGSELLTLTGHTTWVSGVAFAPNGRLVATASPDGTVRLWDAATGEQVLQLSGHGGANSDVVFSPDGRRVASGGADGTLVWDITPSGSGEQATFTSPGITSSVVYSPDGSRLATTSSSGQARLWDPSSGREVLTFSGHEARMGSVFGPDGSILVTGANGSPVVWDTASGMARHVLHTRGTISGVAVSPDGALIATANCAPSTHAVKIWDATSGERVRALTTPRTSDLDFSPNGTLLAAGRCDGTVTFWKVPSFEVLRRIPGNGSLLDAVDFSPDGKRFATSNVDGSVSVWDVATGDLALSLVGHEGEVSDLTFSPDGTLLATAGTDNTARLWDASTGRQLLTLTGSTQGMTSVAFSPDGTRLAVSAKDGTVRIYVLPTGQLVDLARARLTRTWTSAECRQYLHQQSCPNE
jgi:WD40 repeat protein/serine/threonine protein kinase